MLEESIAYACVGWMMEVMTICGLEAGKTLMGGLLW